VQQHYSELDIQMPNLTLCPIYAKIIKVNTQT